ncbi:hypothetical protein FRC01_008844, partial [Tulasnella sp. 417]
MALEPQTDGLRPDPTITRGDSAELTSGHMTNAKRFAMGLPPLKPKTLRRGTRTRQTRGRGGASMLPAVPRRCNILVKDADEGTSFGYLKPEITSEGFYGAFQDSQANALEVSFSTPAGDDLTTQLDLFVENAPIPSKSWLGAGLCIWLDGDPEIHAGSWTFAGIGGSENPTPQGSPPEPVGNTASRSKWESAIWNYNPVTREITAQWIKADGSSPGTYLFYVADL